MRDIYQEVTDRIISKLESGTVPWKKPWDSTSSTPVSITTGRPYRGINVLLLGLEGRTDTRWGTFGAIKNAGGHVRKGEKGTRIVLWKPVTKKSENEEEDSSYVFLRDFVVFNVDQVDGIDPLEIAESNFTPIERAENIANSYASGLGPRVRTGGSLAAYSPQKDVVMMPAPESFLDSESYYQTLFHELVHSTGHEKRLKRIEPALFGTDPYAKEELVAEIGASFLTGICQLSSSADDQSTAYINGWLKRLKGDKRLIVGSAAQAQKAVDLIMSASEEVEAEKMRSEESALVAV